MAVPDCRIQRIGEILVDVKMPLKARFRALFTLKNLGGKKAVDSISACFSDSSDLLKHECAYCLGQMQNSAAIDKLISVLDDRKQAVIVRHEAAEALGAIGDQSAMPALLRHSNDPDQSIRETCELSVSQLTWISDVDRDLPATRNPYKSVDPAPACSKGLQGGDGCGDEGCDLDRVEALAAQLASTSTPLFERYRAMFSLRNIGSEKAVLHLAKALSCPSSALYRHEIAYVLGQARHPAAVTALVKGLADEAEHSMVRHECAEALGAIATEDCEEALKLYLNCEERVVRESCEVALDMCEYECDGVFQYADGLAAAAATTDS